MSLVVKQLWFVSNNWPNDATRIHCKAFFYLVKIIDSQVKLEEELEEFEDPCEGDEFREI